MSYGSGSVVLVQPKGMLVCSFWGLAAIVWAVVFAGGVQSRRCDGEVQRREIECVRHLQDLHGIDTVGPLLGLNHSRRATCGRCDIRDIRDTEHLQHRDIRDIRDIRSIRDIQTSETSETSETCGTSETSETSAQIVTSKAPDL